MTEHVASCHCGKVRFRTTGAPRFIQRCHCESCRRTTGGAFSAWAGFRDEAVERIGGEPNTYESSPGVKRGFCADCGTPIFFQGEKWPGETHFLIGVFDDPEAFRPTGDHFADEALSWVRS